MSSGANPAYDSPSGPPVLLDVPGISHILTPGSSLHPAFLLIVDGVFAVLLLVLFVLALVTHSLHFFVLIVLAVGLWASVKWFINELRKAPLEDQVDSFEKKDN